ncbi:MAG TPA: LysR family transcriptional regulator [Bryobacteraceae bacterium]|nr:LysR family transcriptional regulator [Bryobacteraceae bacterium]
MLKNIDLRLVSVMGELHRTRSVSAAALNLSLSQSTVSMALAKLRRHFDDPLFVRTSIGMEPTPRGAELIEVMKSAEFYMHQVIEHRTVFDPLKSDRVFQLCSTDIAQLTLLPTLLKRLRRSGPSMSVTLRGITDRTHSLLESGEADLAVGFIPPKGAGFCGQRLFQDRFVCALRSDHPRIAKTLTLHQFEAESHVAVTTSGTGHSIVEETIEARKIRREVGLRVPSFIGLGPIVANTDLLAILPEQLGTFFAQAGQIRLVEVPFEIPAYYIYQLWHERLRHDPASQWFRKVIADLFLQKKEAKPARLTATPESACGS